MKKEFICVNPKSLDAKEIERVEGMLATLKERYGYCEDCAQDAANFLLHERYDDV